MKIKLARAIYDSPEKSSDLLYSTNFYAPDPVLFIETPNKRFFFVSTLEFDRASSSCKKNINVVEIENETTCEIISRICRENKIKNISVPYHFPAGLASELTKENLVVEIAKGAFFPQRATKTKLEIAKIATALKIAESAMRKAEQIIAESSVGKKNTLLWHNEPLTSELLRRILDMDIRGNGATSKETIVSCGADSAEPHNIGHGPLKACEPIIIDIFPRSENWYWGDITRTFIKWKAPSKFLDMFEAVKIAGEKALLKIKDGIPASEIHKIAFDTLKERGFKTGKMRGKNCGFFHGLGHGVGLDIHEAPGISPKNNAPLRKGNVITIEPGLYYPNFGGIRIEDLVVVNSSNAENLTSYHKNPLIE